MHNASVCTCEIKYIHLFVYISVTVCLFRSIFIEIVVSINEKKRKKCGFAKTKSVFRQLDFSKQKKYQWEIIKSLPAVSSKQSASNQNSMDGQ